MIENLEPRRLFASTLVDRTLIITGTMQDDRIAVEIRAMGPAVGTGHRYFVFINEVQVATYSLESVSRIRIKALEGHDHVSSAGGASTYIEGSGGNDTLLGGDAHETLNGGNGNDLIVGGRGNDLVAGGAGRDKLAGDYGMGVEMHDGADTLEGGPGDDILSGGGGADRYFGGGGSDTADYSDRADNLLIAIGPIVLFPKWPVGNFGSPFAAPDAYLANPNPEFDPRQYMGTGWLEGDEIATDVEHARGGRGNDVLWGSAGDNRLEGGGGNDNLYGGLGTDSLYGDAGNDRLFAADRTDAMPGTGTQTRLERVHGGGGSDYAMVDWSDPPLCAMIDRLEVLPFLTS